MNRLYPGPRDRTKEVVAARHFAVWKEQTDTEFRMQAWNGTTPHVYLRFVFLLHDHVSERFADLLEAKQ